jgi:tetratricopeptide (TPR) repeat protein
MFRRPLVLLFTLLLSTGALAQDAETAQKHLQDRDYDAALESARQWARSAPRDGDAYYVQGFSLIALEREAEAVNPLERSTELAPEDAYNWGELGRARWLTHDTRGARDAWKRSLRLDSAVFGKLVGDWYTSDFDAVSLAAAELWSSTEPDADQAWFYVGASKLFLDRPDEAIAPLQKSLDLRAEKGGDAKSLSDAMKRRAFVLAQIGFAHEASGNHPAAVKSWRACMALARSECTDAIEEHYLRKRLQPVLAAGIALREISPTFDEGWYYEGAALFYLDREPEAVGPLRRATELDDEDYVNHYMLGYALNYAGDPEAALVALERAAELNSTDADIYKRMAESYDKLGRTREADEARARAESVQEAD